ncbi:hypothetical protein GTY86_15550, partial [Streptomyces sp. SID5770]|nr:hypothetical protein [Streptomyces sp. SID5770]
MERPPRPWYASRPTPTAPRAPATPASGDATQLGLYAGTSASAHGRIVVAPSLVDGAGTGAPRGPQGALRPGGGAS